MPDGDTAESSPENTLVIKSCLKIGLKRQRGSDGERERERERERETGRARDSMQNDKLKFKAVSQRSDSTLKSVA